VSAVVFDLDGTLIDSRADLATAANELLRELGGPPLSEAEVVRMVGEGAAVLVRRVLRAAGLKQAPPHALERFLEIYDGCLLDRTRPYDGTVEMLEAIRGRVPLGVLTNKPERATVRILDGLSLSRFFTVVVGGDSPHGRKPAPAGLHYVAAELGAPAAGTVMVGDSPIDLQTARNAGTAIVLTRFGFGFTFPPEDLPPDAAVIDAPAGVIEIVDGTRPIRPTAAAG
jgi:phosphoglycolate phosphatase